MINKSFKYDAFFFDFDGVLVESVGVKALAFAKIFEHYGSDIVSKVVDYHHKNGGKTRVEKFRHYYQEFLVKPLGDNELLHLCRQFEEHVVDSVIKAPEIPGADLFLKQCQGKVTCFIVSATPQAELEHIVEKRGMHNYFENIYGAPRTKIENLVDAIRNYSLVPSQCIFFGDALNDYQAASETGVNFIGIITDDHSPLSDVAHKIKWMEDFRNGNKLFR